VRIEDILRESCVMADLEATTKQDVLVELVSTLKKASLIKSPEEVVRVILDREKLGSTGIGDTVAIPHGKMKDLDQVLCVFGRSIKGVAFDAVDGKPVHVLFLLIAPEGAASTHLKILSRISRILRDPTFRKRLLEFDSAKAIYAGVIEEDRKI
jgi:nitrogen PTS system EIIA component